jgi:hypothetical protein
MAFEKKKLCILPVSARPPPRGRGLAAFTIATRRVNFNFSASSELCPEGDEPEAEIVLFKKPFKFELGSA